MQVRKPKGFWNSLDNRQQFANDLFNYLKENSIHRLRFSHIKELGGTGLLRKYNWDLSELKQNLALEIDVQHINIHNTKKKQIKDKNHWQNIENQRNFLKSIEKKFNFTKIDDWNRITNKTFIENGGSGLLNFFKGNIHTMLTTIYPSHYFDKKELKTKEFIKNLINYQINYNIQKKEDWYRISPEKKYNCGNLPSKSLQKMLLSVHQDEEWNLNLFHHRSKKATQNWLKICLQKNFPQHFVIESYLHPFYNLNYNSNNNDGNEFDNSEYSLTKGKRLELDVFIPSLNLAFEYQGQQHFDEIPSFGCLEVYKKRDHRKYLLCEQHSINLVAIPYWWDRSISSLPLCPL